jgi:predicted transcriptional regulator
MRGDTPAFSDVFRVVCKRARLLERVHDEERDIRDLRDAVDASRSTIYKAVRELERHRLVESVEGGYRATLFGRLVYRKYERLMAEGETLADLEPVFSRLAADLPLDPVVFRDATVVPADPRAPDEPIDELEAFLRETDRVRSVPGVTRTRYLDFAMEHVYSGDLEVEILVAEEIVEYLLSNHRERLQSLVDSEHVAYSQIEARPRFGLVVADESDRRVALTLYDDRQQMQAFVATDAPEAYAWASETYAALRAEATELAPRLG